MSGLLRHGLWWAEDYAYAGFRQAAATLDRTDAVRLRTGTAAPVVLLPGVYESWRFLAPLARWLHGRGHPVHVVEPLRHNRRPVTDSARHVAEVLSARDLGDVTIVAHSKGGLIGKEVMLGAEGGRIRNMVAIAAPFGGSRYAARVRGQALRIFSPDDPTILRLARETAVNTRITSVAAVFDPHIPEGSALVDARNVLVPTGGHFRILARPEVRTEILRALGT